MQKKFWFPKTMPERLVFFQNFRAKIGKYETELGFTPEQISAMETLADEFVAAYTWVKSCELTLKAAFAWRDTIFENTEEEGADVPTPPAFPPPPSLSGGQAIVEQMYKFRRQIVSRPGYTSAIGRDLGIIGAEVSVTQPSMLAPDLRVSVSEGNAVSISGNMQKMQAIFIEYRPENGDWTRTAFLTNLPATVNIAPQNSLAAERGSIRAVFYKKNAPCGNYSPDYPVVLY